MCPIYKPMWNIRPLGEGPFGPNDHYLNKLGRGLQSQANAKKREALCFVVPMKDFLRNFLWVNVKPLTPFGATFGLTSHDLNQVCRGPLVNATC